MKKRGFTLIELLAVIVILAIIALIAVPTVMNIIEKSEKSAFEDTAYGLIRAAEYYYFEKQMDVEGIQQNKNFAILNNKFVGDSLEIDGNLPNYGVIIISKEGTISLAINNGKYCIKKDYNEDDFTINQDLENCTMNTFFELATTFEDTEVNECVTTGICTTGDSFTIEVNKEETKDFAVISDDGNKVTLIMKEKIAMSAWMSNEDYGKTANIDKGPLTALKVLETATSNWINIKSDPYSTMPNKQEDYAEYTLFDDYGTVGYMPIQRLGAKARMITYTEVLTLSQSGTPSYLIPNTWTSTSEPAHGTGDSRGVYIVSRSWNFPYISYNIVPVIVIEK